MTTYQHQSKNVRNTIFLFLLFSTLTALVGLGISIITKNNLFLVGALIMALAQGFSGYFLGEGMALASAGGEKQDLSTSPALYNIVEDLARIAGIPTPDVYISADPSANAFACGQGPGRASICVNQGLLDMLTKAELEGVLAHEISHIKNRDILTMTMTMVMSSVIAIICDLGIRFGSFNDKDDNNNPFAIVALVISFLVAPFLATLITLAVSRSREYLADASAVQITRYPQGLISALEKISNSPVPASNYSSSTAHFYISEPKKEYNQKVNDGWFSTHPAMENRIKALLDQDGLLEK